MTKRIHQKFWSFSTEVKLPPVEDKHSFLWWSWTTVSEPTEYKHPNAESLLNEVNQFIAENEIDEIISFQNTCRHITVLDYDCEWIERRGGIELTYLK